MASTMHLEFTQAMSDFKTMFPEMDDEVIEAVLRANQGGVDATIDQLLAMTTDNLNENLRNQIEKDENITTPSTTATPKNKTIVTNPEDQPLRVKKGWIPPLLGPLPATFLRLPGLENSGDQVDSEDERIALFLQNEEFMAELNRNQDFMCALNKEEQGRGLKKSSDEEADFKDRLRNMGKLSRKKFAQLSKVFTRQSTKKNGASGSGGLLQEEHSDEDEHLPHQKTS